MIKVSIILCFSFALISCETILDTAGNPMVTGRKYYAKSYGPGLTFEVYNNWDYVLLANDASDPGAGVYFYESGNGWDVGREMEIHQSYKIQMAHSNWAGYNMFKSSGKKLYLAKGEWDDIIIYHRQYETKPYRLLLAGTGQQVFCMETTSSYQGKSWMGFSSNTGVFIYPPLPCSAIDSSSAGVFIAELYFEPAD